MTLTQRMISRQAAKRELNDIIDSLKAAVDILVEEKQNVLKIVQDEIAAFTGKSATASTGLISKAGSAAAGLLKKKKDEAFDTFEVDNTITDETIPDNTIVRDNEFDNNVR